MVQGLERFLIQALAKLPKRLDVGDQAERLEVRSVSLVTTAVNIHKPSSRRAELRCDRMQVVAIIKAKLTPRTFSHQIELVSVITSGSGPSSRIDPARTKSTPFRNCKYTERSLFDPCLVPRFSNRVNLEDDVHGLAGADFCLNKLLEVP
jgi:hypothetical protein